MTMESSGEHWRIVYRSEIDPAGRWIVHRNRYSGWSEAHEAPILKTMSGYDWLVMPEAEALAFVMLEAMEE